MSSTPIDSLTRWTLQSPDRRFTVTVALRNLGGTADYPDAERLYYRVEYDGGPVLGWSPLGIRTGDQDFVDQLSFVRVLRGEILDTYEMRTGKNRVRRFRSNETNLLFENSDGHRIEVTFRAAADGVAFRYRMQGEGEARIAEEASGFHVPEDAVGWMLPFDKPFITTPAHETFYEKVRAGARSGLEGWGFPALFRVSGPRKEEPVYLLISEAGLDRGYAATRLGQPRGTVYRIRFPDRGEGMGVGDVKPAWTLPWTTPWRVIVLGGLATVTQSTLIEDLSFPMHAAFGSDPAWIRPGRSAWSWYSQETGDPALQREYVDFAAEMGWEHVLVDANWDEWPNAEEEVQALVLYAAARGVGIHLWYNSGGPNNLVPEGPRDRMHEEATRQEEFRRIAGWGVKGVKVDFFQSDKQDRIQQYIHILEDAADRQLLVNFHGCTLPRGWQRTYPNLMTMEAVRGAENYKFFPPATARHNVHLVYTRNVVGSMDYTPVTFADALTKAGITYAHQVALAVVYESGIQHFADRADADPSLGFRKVFQDAPFVRTFFQQIPTTWEETLLLDGSPDSHAVLARREADVWYLGGINGQNRAIHLDIPLGFLGDGDCTLSLIRSGEAPDALELEVLDVAAGDRLSIELKPRDGFAGRCVLAR